MKYLFILVLFTTDSSIFNIFRPSDHCMLEPPWHIAQLISAAAHWNLESTAASPQETLQAQGKPNTSFKKLKRFLQFQWILDKALNAGSSQMITQ